MHYFVSLNLTKLNERICIGFFLENNAITITHAIKLFETSFIKDVYR